MELLSTYLDESEYERIEETDTKRADWKLEIEGYRFLVEQKATLLALPGKQQTSDIEATKRFAKQAIIKALRQLHNTEVEFNDGQYIKVVLVYEDYLKTELLDIIFTMEECDIENDHFYWIVTINEMERLLSLCDDNREAFKKVVSEKIKREFECSHDGRGLLQLLLNDGYKENLYLQQDKIRNYHNITVSQAKI